jgi:hypothetical protein
VLVHPAPCYYSISTVIVDPECSDDGLARYGWNDLGGPRIHITLMGVKIPDFLLCSAHAAAWREERDRARRAGGIAAAYEVWSL